jgi:hypothetical protein
MPKYKKYKLFYIRGLEVSELKTEDMPMFYFFYLSFFMSFLKLRKIKTHTKTTRKPIGLAQLTSSF